MKKMKQFPLIHVCLFSDSATTSTRPGSSGCGSTEIQVRPNERRRSWLPSKRLYLLFDEGTLTFNSDTQKVIVFEVGFRT